ncbi:S-layer homology domain-containing protein [Oscillospiraceae bacterium OttesenSCG-928-G22]|nr:S-layer homology domain-containing protein [Oscillospiraceae bacterium OttesenSCG-928-G22]
MTIFRKRALSLLLTLTMVLALLPTLTLPARAAWDGTSVDTTWYVGKESPFIISTEAQLAGLSKIVAGDGITMDDFSGKIIRLTADLDLAGEQWTPIGGYAGSFKGSFDGCGHSITGLTVGEAGAPFAGMAGLFGHLDFGGTVKNLSVVSVGIYGESCVGGLVGQSGGFIANCSVSGVIRGDNFVGGLVGKSGSTGSIINSCTAGTVAGSHSVGGLVGANNGAVENCYAAGTVSGNSSVGGLVGDNSGTLTRGYAIELGVGMDSSGSDQWANVLKIELDDMRTSDFADTLNEGIADMTDSQRASVGEICWTIPAAGSLPSLTLPAFHDGTGDGASEATAYVIRTEAQLRALAAHVNAGNSFFGKYFTLATDLTLTGGSDRPWVPIGDFRNLGGSYAQFDGIFDGGGKTISDLYLGNTADSLYFGLFGYLGGSARNLTLRNVSVTGGNRGFVGGLAGVKGSAGAVTDCHVTGTVTGGIYVGGLAGDVAGGTVSNCHTTVTVTGGAGASAGGLVGFHAGGTVLNCYATGDATGGTNARVGGLVGNLDGGSVLNCYATGDAAGGDNAQVGGLVGDLKDGSVINCYATGDAEGGASAYVGGLVGYIAAGGTVTNGYWNSDAAQTRNSAEREAINRLGVGSDAQSKPGGTSDGTGKPTTAKALADMKMQAFADTLNANITTTGSAMTQGQVDAVGNWRWAILAEGETPTLSLFHDGTGDGRSEATPYVIRTEAQLRVLAQLVSEGKSFVGEHFALANDLALTGEWTPIGLGIRIFRGIFDGGGHTISDLAIGTADSPSAFPYVGLFGSMGNQGTIKNLGVAGAVYGGDGASVGGLAGITTPDSTIVNCYVAGTVSGGVGANVGGLVGSLNGGSATNCYATGAVTGGDGANIGGLVGVISGGSAKNCYAAGDVTGGDSSYIGGLVGVISGGTTITKSYWNADAAQAVGGVGTGIGSTTPKTSAEMKLAPFMTLLQDFVTANPTVGVPWNTVSLSDWAQSAAKNGGMPYLADVIPADDPPIIPPSGGGSVGVTTPPVTVTKPENGAATVSPTNPKKGDTVTVTVTPSEGYETDGITVKDRDGNTLPVTDNGDGTFSFTYGGSPVTVEAGFSPVSEPWESPFRDVKAGDWYFDDVRYVYESGLMIGISQDEFGPGLPISRAMLVTVLYRMAGEPGVEGENPFSDVEGGQWYTDAVIWAAANGITTGYGDGTFGTGDEITREDMCVMLVRFMTLLGIELPALREAADFADAGEISDYAREAVMMLYQAGIIEGKGDGVFDPQGEATRAELAALLHRFLVAAGLETE